MQGWQIIFIFAISSALQHEAAAECACATGNVNIRSGAGITHAILGTLLRDQCLQFKGHMTSVSGSHWANVDYNGQSAWISAAYLDFHECQGGHQIVSTQSTVSNSGCPHIISRDGWGARQPSSRIGKLTAVPGNVYIHHGATPGCQTKSDCIRRIQSYQNYHMDTHGWPDIGYSFVVGEDGNVYQARGWDEIGAHTYGHNTDGLGICIIGDFTTHVPNAAALNAVKQLISCGVSLNKIQPNYVLKGHRDVGQTSCPGDKLYELIKSWPHYHS